MGVKCWEMWQVSKFKDIFFDMLTHLYYSERDGLKNCSFLFSKEFSGDDVEAMLLERRKMEGGLVKPILIIIHLKDNGNLTKRNSQWG